MKNICITLLFLTFASFQAVAWEYNFSTFDDDVKQDTSLICPETEEIPLENFPLGYDCSNQEQQVRVIKRQMIHSNACYQYSCYYQAMSFTETAEMDVQPLTEDPEPVLDAIQALTPEKLGKKTGVKGKKVKGKKHDNDDDSDEEEFTADMWDAGAGTSSMEGLLWSWRMVSDNWQGVWNQKSSYENGNSAASARTNLPSAEHQKHIVMVSDGEDTDGEENAPPGFNRNNIKVRDGQKGFIIPSDADDVPFDVCDAHEALESLTLDDYKGVCTKLKEQNIKVHTVLYGFHGNETTNPLIQCSGITGGQVHNDVSPADLEARLKQIFVEFSVARIQLK